MDAGYTPEVWHDFAVMIGGAAAAIVGLLVVAMSINLRQIVSNASLPPRAAAALITATTPLVIAVLLLIPAQSDRALGIELLVVAIVCGTVLPTLNWPRDLGSQRSFSDWVSATAIPMALVIVPLLLAAVGMLTESIGGLYWIPVVVIAAFLSALTQAWVLLIEIIR